MSVINSALNIIKWLELATDNTVDGYRVKERYRMTTNDWKVWYRPDCNIETAYAFLLMYKHSKDIKYLQLSRNIYDSIIKIRNADNSFPFSHTGDSSRYTNDNSEIPIFLIRMSELDLERKDIYIQSALKNTDLLLTKQNVNGFWGELLTASTIGYPFFTAQAISALATAYEHTNNKANYKIAIEKGLDWLTTNILADGRIKVCNEIKLGVEFWRPPSSDQAIAIRAFAHAELYVTDSLNLSKWKTSRLKLIAWLDTLLDRTGAVKNGKGGKVVTGADVDFITDHVYTTAFAIEAYIYSYQVDKTDSQLQKANKIVNFTSSNIYSSDKAETNGVIRGAYNLKDKNFDTSAVSQNGGEEGGANMVYTGWANAPLASWFLIFYNNTFERYAISTYINNKKYSIDLQEQ